AVDAKIAVKLKDACEKAGGAAKQMFDAISKESQPGVAALRDGFLKAAEEALKKTPDPLAAMKSVLTAGAATYLGKGADMTAEMLKKVGGISRVVDLSTVYSTLLQSAYKAQFPHEDIFQLAAANGKFDPKANINDGSTLKGKAPISWSKTATMAGME